MAQARLTELSWGEEREEGGALLTRADTLINWARKNSIWPLPMGLSCCAIEFMAAAASRFDISRFGAEVARFSPKQADVMIVAGTMTYKMAEAVSAYPAIFPKTYVKMVEVAEVAGTLDETLKMIAHERSRTEQTLSAQIFTGSVLFSAAECRYSVFVWVIRRLVRRSVGAWYARRGWFMESRRRFSMTVRRLSRGRSLAFSPVVSYAGWRSVPRCAPAIASAS